MPKETKEKIICVKKIVFQPHYTFKSASYKQVLIPFWDEAVEWAEENGFIKEEIQTGGILYQKLN